MAKTGRRSGGRAAVRLGAGARAARAAERTPWGSSVGGRRPRAPSRQALLLHSLRRPLREGTGEPRDTNPSCAALRDACAPCQTSTPVCTHDLPACRVAGRCDDDERGAVELLAMRAFAPLPRAGFEQRCAGRSVGDGRDGRGSRKRWFGDGQAGCGCAAAHSGARSSMHVLLSYCVVICCTSRVGVVRCDLVPPASYVVLGICCPYICDVYKSLT
jgi:hypothetical protein